ncbi:MAG: flagellar basal-body MS-ring/collar protein FliF [Pseudomonadota bacterium]
MSEQESGSLVRTGGGENPGTVRQLGGFPIPRQIGLIVAVALALAVGIAVVLWVQKPDYGLLYGSVSDKDVGEVLEALHTHKIDYKIESSSGAIMVPADIVHEARLKLAAQGLPKSAGTGYELLDKETGFGTSQALETVRFQRALEGELARSVTAIQNVRSARVHLALPKQSVFIRNRKKHSASVLVDLYPGRSLEKGQVEAIVHLVASSVPQLEASGVTVVDQKGHLLNAKNEGRDLYLTSKQFEYKKRVEEHLTERVENILTPLVGADGLRAQITADLDFSVTEKTEELFNPEQPSAIRSEQVAESRNSGEAAIGIPGALSNQPPEGGEAPEIVGDQRGSSTPNSPPVSTSKSATRNYELDKTVSHTRLATGDLRRLTVAVVADDKHLIEDGKEISRPHTQEDLNRFTELVKQAVGFNADRGDRVTVTNAAFRMPRALEPLPAPPFWEQSWFQGLIKHLVALLVVVVLVFGIVRPAMRELMGNSKSGEADAGEQGKALPGKEEGGLAEDRLSLSRDEEPLLLDGPVSYEKRLEFAKKMVDDDPKRVAQVIRKWVTVDG